VIILFGIGSFHSLPRVPTWWRLSSLPTLYRVRSMKRRSKVITLLARKGGVGKSVLCIPLFEAMRQAEYSMGDPRLGRAGREHHS
jgi:predicted GTPase